LALIVSETVANALPIDRERININTRFFFTINSFKLNNLHLFPGR